LGLAAGASCSSGGDGQFTGHLDRRSRAGKVSQNFEKNCRLGIRPNSGWATEEVPFFSTVSVFRDPSAFRLKVLLLDHDGRRTEKTLPATNGQFTLDGARDQTPYYEVVLP
jgi:hypothetical protein